jgi:hypothetical protein
MIARGDTSADYCNDTEYLSGPMGGTVPKWIPGSLADEKNGLNSYCNIA